MIKLTDALTSLVDILSKRGHKETAKIVDEMIKTSTASGVPMLMNNKLRAQILRVAAAGIEKVGKSVHHNSGMRNQLFNIAHQVRAISNNYQSKTMDDEEDVPDVTEVMIGQRS